MTEHQQPSTSDRLDQATSNRLAKLAARPVDTTRAERALSEATGATHADFMQKVMHIRQWRLPFQAAAAIIALALIGWFALQNSSPAIASPGSVAELHRSMLAEHEFAEPVDSIDQANKYIARQWREAPPLPQARGARVTSCCVHKLGGVPVAAVRLDYRGEPATLVIAHGEQLKMPSGRTIERNDQRYVTHEVDGVRMIMARHGDRLLCIVGELSTSQLLTLAEAIEF